MFCHEACRAPLRKPCPGSVGGSAGGREGGPVPMCHMKCHEMSCFVMRPAAPLSTSLAEAPLSLSCMSSLHRVSFRPRRRRFPGKRPFFARIAWAPAPAFRAGAHIARLIARTRANARRTSPVRSVGVFFRTGARQKAKRPADAASSLSHSTTDSTGSSPLRELFHSCMNELPSPGRGAGFPHSGRVAGGPV